MLILKHLKTLKTLQHISISIQIIVRELVVSSLKSLSLKLLKILKVHYGNVAANVWCVCMAFRKSLRCFLPSCLIRNVTTNYAGLLKFQIRTAVAN